MGVEGPGSMRRPTWLSERIDSRAPGPHQAGSRSQESEFILGALGALGGC